MTRDEVKQVYEAKMKAATDHFVGEKVDKDVLDKVKKALQRAAEEAYLSIPMAYRDQYEIVPPKLNITVSGSEINVQWDQGLPRYGN